MTRRAFPRLAPLALLALAFPVAAAEPLEQSCRFAEAVGERLHLPDLALRYLEGLKAEGPLYDRTVVALLELETRQESDPARRAEGMARAKRLAQPAMDRILAKPPKDPKAPPRPPLALGDFGTALAYFRIAQGVVKGAADAGPQLQAIHVAMRQLYAVLDASDFGDLYAKLDVMVEYSMVDGGTALLMKEAAGLSAAERLQALAEGVKAFETARYPFDDSENPDAYVGFPNAYLGMAQCHRGIAELAGDPAQAKQGLEDARKVLNAVLKNPAGPEVQREVAEAARYDAAKQLLDLSGRNLVEAKNVVQAFRKALGAAGAASERAALLEARVEMETSRQMAERKIPAAEATRDKALQMVRTVKEGGGPVAAEAESLLLGWEGASTRSRRNWKAEAEAALKEGRFEEGERKFRALLRTARGDAKLLARAWHGLGESYRLRDRHLEAVLAYEKAARMRDPVLSGRSAAMAVAFLQQEVARPLPPSATAAQRRALLELMTTFPEDPRSAQAAYRLSRLLGEAREYEPALKYLRMLKPGDEDYVYALFDRGHYTVILQRRQPVPSEADLAEAERVLSQFESLAAGAKPEKAQELLPLATRAGVLRIQIQVQTGPEKALALIEAFPRSYPGAKPEILAELGTLKLLALAAQGDWAAASQGWEEAARSAADQKPWPLGQTARDLKRILESRGKGETQAGALLASVENQISLRKPFRIDEAAKRFKDNFEMKRYEDALLAGEQIVENDILSHPAYKDTPWALEYFKPALAECYVATGQWAKASPYLDALQAKAVILRRYHEPGQDGLPPPLQPRDRALWKNAALASTRDAERMEAGEERKGRAGKAIDSWTRLLDGMSRESPEYWGTLVDVLRAEVLAGRYDAARNRLRGLWITTPDLGGQRERVVEVLKELALSEPGFAPTSGILLGELEGRSE